MLIYKIVSRMIAKYHESKIYWHPRLLYRNKNKIPIRRPIFFLGVQGGGLTIMSRVIRLLPEIVYISGNNRFWAGEDEMHNKVRFKHLPDALTLRSPGYYNLLGHEKNHPDFGYERAFLYASNEFLNEYRLTESDWTPALDNALRKAIQTCLCVYANNTTTAEFLDMSQTYALKIPFLKRCFPDARFIIVTRDPYAVCWKQAQVSPIFFQDQIRAVQFAAEHWFNSYSYAVQDTKNTGSALLLRFEDFMQDPIGISEKMLCFLDKSSTDVKKLTSQYKVPPLGSSDREKWFPINARVNNRHHNTMPGWAKDIITQQCGELIELFEYHIIE
ncbi:MAG: sulfotransferase [Gammaproteobacteria bacterium]|nr:sulfotransferase [Gammaproteobacteria bacterium]